MSAALTAAATAACLLLSAPQGNPDAAAPGGGRPEGAVALFDGRSLDGWRGDAAIWSVTDGCIRGEHDGTLGANTFLIWQGEELVDFELGFSVRLVGDNNSGVQYRSRQVGDAAAFRLAGYQCDVHPAPRYFGMLYEERGRGVVATHGQRVACEADGTVRVLAQQDPPAAVATDTWHEFRIVARGSRLQHFVDGRLAVEIEDRASQAARRGGLGLQVHAGAPMTVWFRDLWLRRLPTEEVAEVAEARAAAPQWIWDAAVADDDELFFRREFALPAVPQTAQLVVTCDNYCRVYLNDERVAESGSWQAPRFVDVTRRLRQGTNVLAVHGWNDGGPAGLCARLFWTIDGAPGEVVTDRSWRVADLDPEGWELAGFDDSGWAAATELGPLGTGPWAAALPADAFDDVAVGEQPQRPQPADELELAPSFVGERLLRVPSSMGSWVALASHPDGHLFASDQSRGLYLITPAGLDGAEKTAVERLEFDLDGCQGLCWAFDALYAVVNGKRSGLYRLRDTDGDGRLDQLELLRALDGRGEHGPHAVVAAPDGEHLLVLCGNHTRVPELAASRLPRNWGEDRILPRLDDPNGHAVGRMAPGGFLCRVDRDGERWELYAAGFRNAYDVAVQPVTGELFVFDADMEWDMGLPWYRPTRVLHCTSGADFGWRHGSGKWPTDVPDSLPAVADVGPASPTGVLFGYGAKLGDRCYRLLCCDWTFGTIYELALVDDGGSWKGVPEPFLGALPLPVTDAVVGADGRLYVITGGRGLRTTLYRVSYQPGHPHDPLFLRPPLRDIAAMAVKMTREELEQFHGREHPDAVATAWPQLCHDDRFVRHAARLAVEWQPVAGWRQRALQPAEAPWTALSALLALARQGTADDLEPLLAALGRLDFAALDREQRIAWLRVHELAFVRLGLPTGEVRGAVVERLLQPFPTGDDRLDAALCGLLAALDAAGLLERAVPLLAELRPAAAPAWADVAARNERYGAAIARMLDAMPPTDQIAIADALRTVRHGWTLGQRRTLFDFLAAARQRQGGQSYDGYLKAMIDAAWETCAPAEQQALADVVGKARSDPPPFRPRPPQGPPRDWQLEDAAALARSGLRGRDYDAGRNLFFAAGCASCHRFAGEGGAHAPDLTSLGNTFDANAVLEAILEPDKVVSDQYAGAVLTLKQGGTVFGRVTKTELDGVEVYLVVPAAANAKAVRFPAADVARVEAAARSPMPPGLLDPLGEDEMLDLVAFLLSRGDRDGPMFAR